MFLPLTSLVPEHPPTPIFPPTPQPDSLINTFHYCYLGMKHSGTEGLLLALYSEILLVTWKHRQYQRANLVWLSTSPAWYVNYLSTDPKHFCCFVFGAIDGKPAQAYSWVCTQITHGSAPGTTWDTRIEPGSDT